MRFLCLLFTLLLGCCTAAAQTVRFTVIDLGTLDSSVNYPLSTGLAINEHGEVVGNSYVHSTILTHGFIWSSSSGLRDLGVLRVDGGLTARSVNSSTEIVGNVTDEAGAPRAYLWSASAGIVPLTQYRSEAYAINDLGQVAGEYSAGGESRPFVFDPVDGFIDLGLPQGSTAATASSINNSGRVVGTATDARDRYFCKAFTWTKDEGFREVFPNSRACSTAFAVNDSGQVAGYQYSANGWKAFVTDPNGKTRYFAIKNTNVSAYGLNDTGAAVGEAGGRAVLFENGRILDLTSLIPAESGWLLMAAYDINNSGEIVGVGWIAGERHAFVLRPLD